MKFHFIFFIFFFLTLLTQAQVKIGDNPGSINSNSMLEIESGSKGFLGPRVAINNITNVSPLSAPVPEGMLVYSDGGLVADGFYYWDGSQWVKLITGADKPQIYSKTTSSTLTKSETFVVASNDITVTLPAVTATDDGMKITIKNIGSHMDLVVVKGNTGALIDGLDSCNMNRFISRTYVAYNGNWLVQGREPHLEDILDVSPNDSWQSLNEVFEYLDEHMSVPTIVRLSGSEYEVSSTITIDLPYPVTIQGASYGSAAIIPAVSLSGKPMFRCVSETYFKMLDFVGSPALAGYGTNVGEDAIRYVGQGTYNEVKDCIFDGFYNTILDSTNAELWIFECDFYDATNNGLLIHGNVPGVKIRISETDFINCTRGINLDKGSAAAFHAGSIVFECVNATDTALVYHPAGFAFSTIIIKNAAWNHLGYYIEGFDFSRTDGRDASAEIENNLGIEDKTPHMHLNVVNNTSATVITTASTWYKCVWTNTGSYTCKLKVEDNKVTYQPTNRRDANLIITGSIISSIPNKVVTIGIVKNGNTSVRYGETNLRVTTADQPFQFSTVIYLDEVSKADYFELYCTGNSNGLNVTFKDVQWYMNTQ